MEDKIFNFLINYFSNIDDRGVDEMNNFRGNITSNEVVEWLKNISAKQLSEELEYLATSLEETIGTSPHSRDTIISYLQQAAQWQKDKTLNNVCKWLDENADNYVWYGFNDLSNDIRKVIED